MRLFEISSLHGEEGGKSVAKKRISRASTYGACCCLLGRFVVIDKHLR